jgi:hypothetical protein
MDEQHPGAQNERLAGLRVRATCEARAIRGKQLHSARCARGERAHRGRPDLLAGTAVGRGKRVHRRTEPGAGCCYGDVEDEEEEEEPLAGEGGRWIRGRSAARRWTSSIPAPSTSGSPASESERPARHGPYEESGYTRRGVRAARELTGVGRISWPGLRWGGGRGFADERSRARGAATATSRMRRRSRGGGVRGFRGVGW